MNLDVAVTDLPRTASRFMGLVISHERRKKDTHSLIEYPPPPCEDAGGLSREYIFRIQSVS